MKNKVFGFLVFFFFLVGVVALEGSGLNAYAFSPFLLVIGSTAGLSLMYYRKGMNKSTVLHRIKKYFIFSGYMGTLVAVIMISQSADASFTLTVWAHKISSAAFCILYGYILAYITDTFLE